jgi:hypothetical protein
MRVTGPADMSASDVPQNRIESNFNAKMQAWANKWPAFATWMWNVWQDCYDNATTLLDLAEIRADMVTYLAGTFAKLATIGNHTGVIVSSSATVTLTHADVGKHVHLGLAGAQTVTLPNTTDLPAGSTVNISKITTTGSATITGYSANQIDSGNGVATSLTIRGMEECVAVWGGSYWLLRGSILQRIAESALGGVQNVTSSRNFGTTYTNTTKRLMLLILGWYDTGAGVAMLTLVDSIGTKAVSYIDITGQVIGSITVPIQPNGSWNMSTSGITKSYVWEYYL